MPQIAQILDTYASQIFWSLVVFGVLYVFIGRAMLPKIEAVVDLRARMIADDLAAAEAARVAADASEEAWRLKMAAVKAEVQAETAAAKARAAQAAEVRVKAADAEANVKFSEAETAIRASTAAALAMIEDAASSAAQDIVTKLLGETVTPDSASAAVRRALANG